MNKPLNSFLIPQANRRPIGPTVFEDVKQKRKAMTKIASRPFVNDADNAHFRKAQKWIEDSSIQIPLPNNFVGGVMIIRICRYLLGESLRSERLLEAVYDVAAAYDFAFLALGHADDEADGTKARMGETSRHITHPNSRAVDAVNILLAGIHAYQRRLNSWPQLSEDSEGAKVSVHANSTALVDEFVVALKQASFPILFGPLTSSIRERNEGLQYNPAKHSLDEVEAYSRHRAQTYFMQATKIAILLSGFTKVSNDLYHALEEFYRSLGMLGAVTDDLQDLCIDLETNTKSICTILVFLCLSDDCDERPQSTKDASEFEISELRSELDECLHNEQRADRRVRLLELFERIGLRDALKKYTLPIAKSFALATFQVVSKYGMRADILIDIASVALNKNDLKIPEQLIYALDLPFDDPAVEPISLFAADFIAEFIMNEFWPQIDK